MNLLAQLAQVAQEHQLLYVYGPMGVFCGWLMWRDEKRAGDQRSLSHRIDGLTRALLVDMTERDSCGPHAKRYAREEIAKIDARIC